MSNNHFSYFRVKNFKRFKDLEVKDIGQFNLVLGDNNVGKTSLLEGLLFDENFDVLIWRLAKALYKRQLFGNGLIGGVWEPFVNKDELVNNDYVTTAFMTSKEDAKKEFPLAFDKTTKELFLRNTVAEFDEFINQEKFEKKNWQINNPSSFGWPSDFVSPLIQGMEGHSMDLVDYYSSLINNGPRQVRNDFIKTLRSIDKSVLSIDYDTISVRDKAILAVESEKSDGRILLAFQGDGFVSLFRSLLYLMLFRDEKVMVDEIDAGIHYSRMKDYWKVILQAANENNVQIFATTHNKECMESYKLALEELGSEYMEKARTITLKESRKNGDITAYTAKFEVLQSAMKLGNELR